MFASQTIPSAQMTAHDAAHEIGHTLGLEHDGTTSGATYYGGHANWVPIMGITNQKAVAQWSKGEYAGANNTENDLAIIGSNGDSLAPGSLLLPDDYPNSGATPAPLTSAASYQANGIISSAADSDVFTIIGSCTNLQASATSIDTLENAGQTLDIKLDVLNASNSQLESNGAGTSTQKTSIPKSDGDDAYSPDGMNAAVSHTATPGAEYRIRVSGTSSGTASNGYTTYGSIGSYHLTVTGCTADPGATAPGAPTGVSATPNARTTTAKVTWTPSSGTVSGYKFTVDGSPIALNAGAGATSATIPDLTPGQNHAVRVIAYGPGGDSAPSGSASVRIDTYVPSAGPGVSVSVSGTKPTFHWTVPDNPGRAVLTGWRVEVFRGATKVADDATIPAGYSGGTFGTMPLGSYSVRVTPQYTADDTAGIKSTTTSFAIITKPSAPRIGAASSGKKGKPITAGIRWAAPSSTGGSPITAYKVVAYKLNAQGKVARTYVSSARPAGARSYVWKLPKGRYKFRVVAYNKAGASPGSAYSKIATAK